MVYGVFGLIGVMGFLILSSPAEVNSDVKSGAVAASLDFKTEWQGLEAGIGSCASRSVAQSLSGDSLLYWCVNGREETAKLFINEDAKQPGKVLNIKMMWNEWKAHTRAAGADQQDASRMARVVMQRYAPSLEHDVLEAYWGKEARSFVSGGFRFDYRWTPGPGIDEHLLTVTPG